MKTSFFDLFKLGIGPSSSHTVGPMRAANRFVASIPSLPEIGTIRAELYGSLALTGIGHGTDRAVLLGLSGQEPDQVDPGTIEDRVEEIRSSGQLRLGGSHRIPFREPDHLLFHRDEILAGHPNGMRFTAWDRQGTALREAAYYSVGGGFVVEEGESGTPAERRKPPFPFQTGTELLAVAREAQLPIWRVIWENELAWRSETEVREHVRRVWVVMRECIWRGLHTEGILPGGLGVRRRAPRLYQKLLAGASKDPLATMDWVNVWAMAVNEENAAGGRVVTAPTNGAAGVLPAVIQYYVEYLAGDAAGIERLLLTASAIGALYKENASISGAEVGCQGEVGVACSMAAGGLVAATGGSNEEVEHAAEIAMEHNLGMTCDPIGGLVQIPCIERNAIGAVKAINAARLARTDTGDHKISLDQVIRTMYQTGLDMQAKYKETSLAGLAVLSVNSVEC